MGEGTSVSDAAVPVDVNVDGLDEELAQQLEQELAGELAAVEKELVGAAYVPYNPHKVVCRRCAAVYSAFGGGHCSVCCRTFTSDSAFDAHRSGRFADNSRFCLEVESLEKWRLTSRGWTPYPAWVPQFADAQPKDNVDNVDGVDGVDGVGKAADASVAPGDGSAVVSGSRL